MTDLTMMKPTLKATGADADLRCRIVSALRATGHPQLGKVDAFAHEGLVTLTGRVSTYYQKQLAQSVTFQLKGVESLQNEIVVT